MARGRQTRQRSAGSPRARRSTADADDPRSGGEAGWFSATRELYRFVWRTSARSQILLTVLSTGVFVLELAPLELQRRIVNTAVKQQTYHLIAVLCGLYLLVVLTQGGLKLVLNVYRGSVIEATSRRLRLEPALADIATATKGPDAEERGVAISIITSEVDAVGGIVGTSFSEPVLNGGILVSIFGYMLVMQPLMALVAMALFIPQVFFIPVVQNAINRRTAKRIKTVRALAVDVVDEGEKGDRETTYRERVGDVYRLNMQIYRRKFSMTFVVNLLFQIGVIGILSVGGWFLMQGEIEVGLVVAFISGLTRTTDPWNDLVDFFREVTNAGIKYQLIAQVLGKEPGADPPPG